MISNKFLFNRGYFNLIFYIGLRKSSADEFVNIVLKIKCNKKINFDISFI